MKCKVKILIAIYLNLTLYIYKYDDRNSTLALFKTGKQSNETFRNITYIHQAVITTINILTFTLPNLSLCVYLCVHTPQWNRFFHSILLPTSFNQELLPQLFSSNLIARIIQISKTDPPNIISDIQTHSQPELCSLHLIMSFICGPVLYRNFLYYFVEITRIDCPTFRSSWIIQYNIINCAHLFCLFRTNFARSSSLMIKNAIQLKKILDGLGPVLFPIFLKFDPLLRS